MYKLFIGIGLVAFPQSCTWVGLGVAVAGLLMLTVISIGSSWFLLKARNKYPHKAIRDLADLGEVCYGPYMRIFC
jgi:amino acid permease